MHVGLQKKILPLCTRRESDYQEEGRIAGTHSVQRGTLPFPPPLARAHPHARTHTPCGSSALFKTLSMTGKSVAGAPADIRIPARTSKGPVLQGVRCCADAGCTESYQGGGGGNTRRSGVFERAHVRVATLAGVQSRRDRHPIPRTAALGRAPATTATALMRFRRSTAGPGIACRGGKGLAWNR